MPILTLMMSAGVSRMARAVKGSSIALPPNPMFINSRPVSDAAMADEFIDATHRADGRERLLSEPGTTWVLPAAEQVPDWLTGGRDSIAMRLTPHPVARALCEAVAGPVVSTSANRSGHVPARSAMQLRRRFGAEVDCVLAGTAGGRPTAIRRYPDGERLR